MDLTYNHCTLMDLVETVLITKILSRNAFSGASARPTPSKKKKRLKRTNIHTHRQHVESPTVFFYAFGARLPESGSRRQQIVSRTISRNKAVRTVFAALLQRECG